MIRFTSKYKNISKIICRKYLVKKIKMNKNQFYQNFKTWGFNENKACIQVSFLHIYNTIHLNVQCTNFTRLYNIFYGFFTTKFIKYYKQYLSYHTFIIYIIFKYLSH